MANDVIRALYGEESLEVKYAEAENDAVFAADSLRETLFGMSQDITERDFGLLKGKLRVLEAHIQRMQFINQEIRRAS